MYEEIDTLQFLVATSSQISSNATINLTNRNIYSENKHPEANGPLDPRLGPSLAIENCSVCLVKEACPGHFGKIDLHVPVFHCGYFKHVYNILNCICLYCGTVLLQKKFPLNIFVLECRKVKKCPKCFNPTLKIKKLPGYKLVAESKDLNPSFVYNLFNLIDPRDYHLLSCFQSPVNLLIKNVAVMPNICRPSVKTLMSSNEDDITIKLCEIVQQNNSLKSNLLNGQSMQQIRDDWDNLQLNCNLLINSDLPMYNKVIDQQNVRGIVQRLKGKFGRFRGNLSGKRVDYSGRTVISPDPNLSIEEVGVPIHICKILTVPVRCNSYNIEYLQKLVYRKDLYPGANYIRTDSGKIAIKFARDDSLILKIGDIVERHLVRGDYVLFNRQPSLHRISIMAHKVVPHRNKTLRFNECVCTPYNADFDGDEMNIHVPQTVEAIAEASVLMNVGNNLCTPRNDEPLVACTQDFITAMYLLTRRCVFFDRSYFGILLATFADFKGMKRVRAAVQRPVVLYTGKQVFAVLLALSLEKDPDFGKYSENTIKKLHFSVMDRKNEEPFDHEKAEQNEAHSSLSNQYEDYSQRNFSLHTIAPETNPFIFHPKLNMSVANKSHRPSLPDTSVIIKNGHYLAGQLDKSIIGSENKKTSIIYSLIKIHRNCAIHLMNSISKLSAFYLSNLGFSIGLDDVEPSLHIKNEKNKAVDKIYGECLQKLDLFSQNKLKALPGCTAIESLESNLSSLLSKIRDVLGNECIKYDTSPVAMQFAGSKGSKINVAQMVACVGQQIIGGKRISNGFVCNVDSDVQYECVGSLQSILSGGCGNIFDSRSVNVVNDLNLRSVNVVNDSNLSVVNDPNLSVVNDPNLRSVNVVNDPNLRSGNVVNDSNSRSGNFGDDLFGISTMQDKSFKILESNNKSQNDSLVCGTFQNNEEINVDGNDLSHFQGCDLENVPSLHKNNIYAFEDLNLSRNENSSNKKKNIHRNSQSDSTFSPVILDLHNELKINDQLVNYGIMDNKSDRFIHNNNSESITQRSQLPGSENSQTISLERNKQYTNNNNSELMSRDESIHHPNDSDFHELDLNFQKEFILSNLLKFEDPFHDDSSFRDYLSSILLKTAQTLKPQKPATNNQETATNCNLSSRTLPHFHSNNSLIPIAKGFVKNSFFSGLNPIEFFFHAVSGREGLVDTAVKTAETGYMQRRLMKALEDLKTNYDKTIRNAQNEIVQFYSEDEPGTAVGAIAGQSIGEPGTQMTLKTFHFAGVASMNITLGVPRLKEIINGTKNINTPIIKAEIHSFNEYNDLRTTKEKKIKKKENKDCKSHSQLIFAQQIKAKIEKSFLKDVASSITETYGIKETYITIEIDIKAIQELLLPITLEDIRNQISNQHKIVKEHISINKNTITVILKKDYFTFKAFKRNVLETIIYGIKSINRCVINEDNNNYSLIIEGTGLQNVLATVGIKTATTNAILEIADVLGIEAARKSIINEILYTINNHGITINLKHVELLADTMTFKGSTNGITRFGIGKMKMSTLMLASFEQTAEHLFNSAVKGTVDDVKGVSESIILGKTMNVGTGIVKLLHNNKILPIF